MRFYQLLEIFRTFLCSKTELDFLPNLVDLTERALINHVYQKIVTQRFICPDALLSYGGKSICRSMISLLIKNHPHETTLIHFKANHCLAVTLGFCDIFYQITKSSRDFALIVEALSSPFPPLFPMFKII